MVLAFKPDSRATLRKVTPRSLVGEESSLERAGFCWEREPACSQSGRANASTLSNESTRADRLRDFRKTRREGNNEVATWRSARARIRPYSLYSVDRDFASA